MRSGGILMPLFSLPGKYGIGCLSEEAYRFADFLKESGVSYWQMLPLGPTSFGDSPYQSYSTFAGNPYFIDLEELIRLGLLTEKLCDAAGLGPDPETVDYAGLKKNKTELLRKAYENVCRDRTLLSQVDAWAKTQAHWLPDYCLFMALKEENGGRSFQEWPDDLRMREPEAMAKAEKRLAWQTGFYTWTQYEFDRQWKALRGYCRKLGIRLIGDVPIYVAADSADVWGRPELFQLDAKNLPTRVAGCPPDAFAAGGQLWGNPLYDWEEHEKQHFSWWMSRMRRLADLVDVVRIDHFRGFASYYSIPAGAKDARVGHWVKGPGNRIFKVMKEELPQLSVIAEDLGFITKSVKDLVRRTGFPNMKVLQFAFDPDDAYGESMYLPHNYGTNCVAYTGTHDNDTTMGWLSSLDEKTLERVRRYLNAGKEESFRQLTARLRDAALLSVAGLCVIPMQDWLMLGSEARINTPSTLGGNWKWRMKEGEAGSALAREIRVRMAESGRVPLEWRKGNED